MNAFPSLSQYCPSVVAGCRLKVAGWELATFNLKLGTLAMVAALCLTGGAHAATASFSTTAPAVGANDISQLTGHVTSGSAASQKKSNVGAGDDNAVYLDSGRPAQGQTFKTGTNANGYQITAVTLRQVTYNTYALVPDITYSIRITLPSGSSLTVLGEETA